MSRLSSIHEFRIDKFHCFFCEEEIKKGAEWSYPSKIAVCTDLSCIEKLIHITIDALWDQVYFSKQDTRSQLETLQNIVEKVFWYKKARNHW